MFHLNSFITVYDAHICKIVYSDAVYIPRYCKETKTLQEKHNGSAALGRRSLCCIQRMFIIVQNPRLQASVQ